MHAFVRYCWRPGQVRAGESDSLALVTRENKDGTLNLRIYADGNPDPIFQRGVPKRTQEVQTHCWYAIESAAGDLQAQVSELREQLDRLEERIANLGRVQPPTQKPTLTLNNGRR